MRQRQTDARAKDDLVYAGVDIGGTKIYTVLCTAQGHILAQAKAKTPSSKNPQPVIKQTAGQIKKLLKSHRISAKRFAGVGIGFAGLVNYHTGVVESSVIFPPWHQVPLQTIFAEMFSVQIAVDNDANAAAYGEWWLGAGEQTENMLCLTLGTGIGGGLILRRKLYRGSSCTAGEFGHMTLVQDGPLCWCGNPGCPNPLASGSAIAVAAQQAIRQGALSSMSNLCNGHPEKITARIVALAAKQNDPLAQKIIAFAAVQIGVLLASLINAFNPDCIVLTGSLVKLGSDFLDIITSEAGRRAFAVPFQHAKIIPGRLQEASGALGAAGILINKRK